MPQTITKVKDEFEITIINQSIYITQAYLEYHCNLNLNIEYLGEINTIILIDKANF